MGAFVIDVNVGITANGMHAAATPQHILACVKGLTEARAGLVCLDHGDYILSEYRRHLWPKGQPGVGDEFMQWVYQNQCNQKHCERVHITPCAHDDSDFDEFPRDIDLAQFDRSDRKYVAVAIGSRNAPEILNATDRGWWVHKAALEQHGLRIRFLCPELM